MATQELQNIADAIYNLEDSGYPREIDFGSETYNLIYNLQVQLTRIADRLDSMEVSYMTKEEA
mgnify:CR=1 FL=1|tara:strand:- start:188 stop:376 length:189 start_codon:yes stop_codon:yes gene_type:complete